MDPLGSSDIYLYGPDFSANNLAQNSARQAVAGWVAGDKARFKNCRHPLNNIFGSAAPWEPGR